MNNMTYKMDFKKIAKLCFILLLTGVFASCSKTDPLASYSRIPPDRNIDGDQDGEGDGKGGLFEKGFGTAEKPYIIVTAAQIANMSGGLVQGKMIHFQLGADIDMQAITDWTPLNSASPNDRYIHFDGNNHIIKNFTCKNKDYASFFGILAGVCKNVGFYNADVEASANSGAGVIGGYIGVKAPNAMEKTGQVENCYVSGTVKGRYAGGIASRMGRPYGGQICYVKNSYSTVEVTSTDNEAGGIIGTMFEQGEVSFCYATGVIRGGNAVGGIAAIVMEGAKVTNSVAWNWKLTGPAAKSGRVVGSLEQGESGFQANPLASDSYAWQNIVCAGFTPQSDIDPKSSGAYHGESATVSALQNTVSGWGPEWYAVGNASMGFPILAWQQERGDYADYAGHDNEPEGDFANGTGTAVDPYVITKAEHISNMSKVLIDQQKVYFVLGADIDMAGITTWTPLNNASGYHKWIDFDGRNHVIRNFSCHSTASSYYASFFGVLCGEVRNVGFVDADVSSTTTGIGIIAGYVGFASGASGNYTGRIINCYTTGTIKGSGAAGGIAGILTGAIGGEQSYIKNCYSFATVVDQINSGNGKAGGILGRKVALTGYMENCYAAGDVSTTGNGAAGGIFGQTDASNTFLTIKDCVAWNTMISVSSGTNVGRIVGANANTLVSANNSYAYSGMVLMSGSTTITASDQTTLAAAPFHGVGKSSGELHTIVTLWDPVLWSKTVNGYPVFSWHQQ